MKRNMWLGLWIGMLSCLVLLGVVGAVNAQGEKTPGNRPTVQPLAPTGGGGPDAPLGTTFSYQGKALE